VAESHFCCRDSRRSPTTARILAACASYLHCHTSSSPFACFATSTSFLRPRVPLSQIVSCSPAATLLKFFSSLCILHLPLANPPPHRVPRSACPLSNQAAGARRNSSDSHYITTSSPWCFGKKKCLISHQVSYRRHFPKQPLHTLRHPSTNILPAFLHHDLPHHMMRHTPRT
jgi:hypothetical protein